MAEEVEELVKRLRDWARLHDMTGNSRANTKTLSVAAADTIESLRASLPRVEEERDEAMKALEPFAFETSPNVRFIFTHNPEALAGEYAHDNADFKGLCVLVIADPTWTSHMAVPEFHGAVKNAREALRLSRASTTETERSE